MSEAMEGILQARWHGEEVVSVATSPEYPLKDLMGFAGWLHESGCEVEITLPHAIIAKRVGESIYHATL